MLLGIDLGGTKVAAGLVDEQGVVSERFEEPTDPSGDEAAVRQIQRILTSYQGRYHAAGLGIPGIADSEKGTVWAPNIRNWDHIPLQGRLQEGSSATVVVESDRNTAVLAETLFGAGRGLSDVIFLILGTGIGAGIWSGGRLVRGRQEIAGAVGWVPIQFRGALHPFESVAAGPAIAALAESEGLASTLPALADTARRGNLPARTLLGEVGEVVGQFLSTLVSTFNPELIVIGGGVANVWDLLEGSALQTMQAWGQPVALQTVRVQATALGGDAGILGAAAAAYQSVIARNV